MTNSVPGSPEWFQDIADRLNSEGSGSPTTDAQLAALISGLQTMSRAAVVAVAQVSADAAQAEAIRQAGQLVTDATRAISDAFNSADGDILRAANQYTDEHSGDGGTSADDLAAAIAEAITTANGYSDDQDDVTLISAHDYTDNAITLATNSIETYSDAADTVALGTANQYTDDTAASLLNALTVAMDSKDTASAADTLAAAIAYVNAHPGGGASSAYVDQGDATALSSAKTYADSGDVTNLAAAKTYTDTAKTAAQTYADNKDVTVLSSAKTYADGLVTDTGWVAITPITGYETTSSLRYRKIGKRVQINGALAPNTGTLSAAVTGIATLPAAVRPDSVTVHVGLGSSNQISRLTVNTNGTIDMGALTAAAPSLRLDGITFLTA